MTRRHWKRLGIALEILTIAAILLAIALPKLLDLNRYKGLVVAEIQKAVGGTVGLERLSWGIGNGIWLTADGLAIADASAFPGDLWVSRIRAHVRLGPLLRKKIVLESLALERPEVRLRLAPDRQEAAQPPGPTPAGAKPAGTPVPVRIERLTVQKGRFRLEDALTLPGQDLVRVFHEVDIQAGPLIPGQPITFAVALRDEAPLGLGALQAHVAFSGLTPALGLDHPKLTLEASLASLHSEAVRPYLGSSPLAQRLSGSVSLTLRYEGDFISGQHRAQGMLDLGRLTYADPALWDAELAGAGTTVGYRVRLDRETLTVEELAVRRGALSLTAQAVVDNLGERPVIRNAVLASDVELREVIPLLPWKVLGRAGPRLRQVLEDGGRITIEHARLPRLPLAEASPTPEAILPGIDLTARIAGVSVRPSPDTPKIRDVSGILRLANGVAEVEGLRGRVGAVSLPAISARITGVLAQPRLEGTVKGQLRIGTTPEEDVTALLRRLGLDAVYGAADLDLAFALETAKPEDIRLQGRIGLREVTAKAVLSPAQLEGLTADLTLTPDVATIANLSATLAVPAAGSTPAGRVGLRLQGRIDGWRRRPAVTLQRFATSPISLPVAASLVPWDTMGESAGALRAILMDGGSVTIEELSLPRIDLSKPPKELTVLLPQAKAVATLADLKFQLHPGVPKFERMTGRASLDGGVVTATGVRGQVGILSLPGISFRASHLDTHPRVTVQAKGPVQLAETRDPKSAELLKDLGLQSLTGSADIDAHAEFDWAQPQAWVAGGSLMLAGVRAQTYPAGIIVEDLRGRVSVDRRNAVNIATDEVTGKVDGAPVRVSGILRGLGTPDLTVDATVYAKGLDLAHAREFFPSLTPLSLAGRLDMDVAVLLPAAAANARLNGTLAATNLSLRLPAYGVTVSGGDAELALRGASAEILRMQLQVNDQVLAVTGQISNPMEPDIRLVVTSPELDLDRLLPPDNATPATSSPPAPDSSRHEGTPGKPELPPIARMITAQLQLLAPEGQYRGLRFRDLRLGAAYERGLLPRWDLDFSIEGGRVRASGSADLRDPERIPFAVRPHITSPQVELLAPVLGIARPPATGPLSLTGDLHGQTGDTKDLLASLRGTLAIRLGPGRYTRIGRFGGAMAKILSFGSARGLLSGRLMGDLTGRGLSYQTITAEATFDAGSMDVASFSFQSDAMSLAASGRVDLLTEQLDMRATLGVLGVVDKALQFVPILGRPAQALTSLHLRLTGPLDDPDVRIAMGEGTRQALTGESQGVGTVLKGIGEFFKKGFNTLLGK